MGDTDRSTRVGLEQVDDEGGDAAAEDRFDRADALVLVSPSAGVR